MNSKKIVLSILLILGFAFNISAQIKYEKGYIINNVGVKSNVLIQNKDWKANPTSINYKVDKNAKIQEATIASVEEFGIFGVSKYSRHVVEIDLSSNKANELTEERNPLFEEKTLFLRNLLEGDASLYFYEGNGLTRYFFSLNSDKPKQLIYKKYLKTEFRVDENRSYHKQLYSSMDCESISIDEIKKVDYRQKDLIEFFKKYNTCKNSEITIYKEERKQSMLNFYLRPGINYSSLDIYNYERFIRIDFENQINFRIGLEAELILPFNKNKWAFIAEPSYHKFSTKTELDNIYRRAVVDFNYIEVPLGVRHYIFLNERSKIFANIVHVIDFNLKSSIDFETGIDLKLSKRNKWSAGIGYNYNSKFSIEARYQLSSNVLGDYNIWNSEFKTSSIIIGYNFL